MTDAERRVERGRLAYEAVDHDSNDAITNLYDLICDMLHFADSLPQAVGTEADNGRYVIHMADWHYTAEVRESTSA